MGFGTRREETRILTNKVERIEGAIESFQKNIYRVKWEKSASWTQHMFGTYIEKKPERSQR